MHHYRAHSLVLTMHLKCYLFIIAVPHFGFQTACWCERSFGSKIFNYCWVHWLDALSVGYFFSVSLQLSFSHAFFASVNNFLMFIWISLYCKYYLFVYFRTPPLILRCLHSSISCCLSSIFLESCFYSLSYRVLQ